MIRGYFSNKIGNFSIQADRSSQTKFSKQILPVSIGILLTIALVSGVSFLTSAVFVNESLASYVSQDKLTNLSKIIQTTFKVILFKMHLNIFRNKLPFAYLLMVFMNMDGCFYDANSIPFFVAQFFLSPSFQFLHDFTLLFVLYRNFPNLRSQI
jgi:hypothetical protein